VRSIVAYLAALALLSATPAAAGTKILELKPAPGSAHTDFDQPSYVIYDPAHAAAPLVVFLPGTGGKPSNAADLMTVVAGQGYRVLGLAYDDVPAVAQVCPRDPDPDCSAAFRQMRVDGTRASGRVHNPPAEAIIPRLVTALRALVKSDPDHGWDQYLDGDQPRWERIVVSGLSQGAGMAAYIAKHHAVRRVVLFSSPWDVTGADHHPAPWLSATSQTPPERWYAEYHRRELTAALIVRAYVAMAIPADHIRVFDHDLPAAMGERRSENPYHGATIRDVSYAADWRALFGQASAP
jgi:predicted esterase